MSSVFAQLQDAYFACVGSLCQPSANIKLNGRSFKILKLLGGKSNAALASSLPDSVSQRAGLPMSVRDPP